MGNNLLIRNTKAEDIITLSKVLRASDKEEIEDMGYAPLNALLDGYFMSDECYSAFVPLIDKKVNNLLGVFGFKKDTHSIWFLGSDLCMSFPKEWIRTAGYYIRHFLEITPILANTVSIKNKLHIKWLKHMGAVFSAPYLINNNYFQDFYILKHN